MLLGITLSAAAVFFATCAIAEELRGLAAAFPGTDAMGLFDHRGDIGSFHMWNGCRLGSITTFCWLHAF